VMLGEPALRHLDLDTPRILHTRHAHVDLLRVIYHTCTLIDQFEGNLDLLRNFTPDESIVRAIVMMLAPSWFFAAIESPLLHSASKEKQLTHLCEYITSNLDQPLSLTTLESISGLSGRVLQKEFKKTHDCAPLQWVREQRLAKARHLLNMPTAYTTVSSVAAQCGFDNFSDFARRYSLLYQELPSETLKKALLFR